MRMMKRIALVGASLLALAACSKENTAFRSFYSEAGSEIETRDFGNATMNNTLVQSGERSYAINLTRRFAADVPNTINFDFDSYVLDAEARSNLRRQADWMLQFPEVRFRVYGHTDLVGSAAYNERLGMRRAQAAVAYLNSLGVSRSRVDGVVSKGKTQPIVYVQGPERQNRRTVTEVVGFVQTSPLILNGKYAEVIFREYVASAVPPHAQESAGEQSAGGTTQDTGG